MKRLQITKAEAHYIFDQVMDKQIGLYDYVDDNNKQQMSEAQKTEKLLAGILEKMQKVIN